MNSTDPPPGTRMVRRAGRALSAPLDALRGAALGVRHAYRLYHPPNSRVGRTPENKGLATRRMHITTTRDAVTLDAWAVPGDGPHTVVICHGMERSKSSVLGHIEMLHRAGHNVVAYDMRNHGESSGDRRYGSMARRYTSDLRDVLRAVAADPELGGGRLAVLGFSFSAWPALYVLRDPGVAVSAVVADSGPMYEIGTGLGAFATLRRGSLPERLRRAAAFVPYRFVFRTVALHMLAIKDWPPELPGVTTRLMFVAGAQDPVVGADQVRRVAESYPGSGFWASQHAMHMNALRFDRHEYTERVLDFLAAAFAEGTPAAASEDGTGPYGKRTADTDGPSPPERRRMPATSGKEATAHD
ncbi:alpha/beta hydrolase [Streptomyces abyssalis]|uniref:alpha/beta hydrolase n=1 Tax=Streptomyces abyssalis TaxID=933944 RepID=UPI0009A08BF3|nr:alpha/beta fold hydrolase [Streptomyces abyssalis]